jgi:hypothetical protein
VKIVAVNPSLAHFLDPRNKHFHAMAETNAACLRLFVTRRPVKIPNPEKTATLGHPKRQKSSAGHTAIYVED